MRSPASCATSPTSRSPIGLTEADNVAQSRYLFTEEIIERARREFADDADRVVEELDRLPDTRDRDPDRLARAVLDLSRRDVAAVVGLVDQALLDWREVLTWVDDT